MLRSGAVDIALAGLRGGPCGLSERDVEITTGIWGWQRSSRRRGLRRQATTAVDGETDLPS